MEQYLVTGNKYIIIRIQHGPSSRFYKYTCLLPTLLTSFSIGTGPEPLMLLHTPDSVDYYIMWRPSKFH